MKKLVFTASVFFLATTVGLKADQPQRLEMKGHFFLFSGSVGDWQAATPEDAKLFLDIEGDAAKRVYAAMGAGAEQPTEDEFTSLRQAGDLACTYDRSEGVPEPYSCYFAIDLKTGKTVNSIVE